MRKPRTVVGAIAVLNVSASWDVRRLILRVPLQLGEVPRQSPISSGSDIFKAIPSRHLLIPLNVRDKFNFAG